MEAIRTHDYKIIKVLIVMILTKPKIICENLTGSKSERWSWLDRLRNDVTFYNKFRAFIEL